MKKIVLMLFITTSIILSQTNSEILNTLFNYSNDITSITDNLVPLSVDAVWLASELAGKETTFGTLSQNAQGDWSYKDTPTDKLISIFSDGSSLEFLFNKFNGYKNGDADDFKNSHDIDFNTYIQNYINLQIQSVATPNSEKTSYIQIVSGTIEFNGETNTININHTFDKHYEIGSYISIGIFNDYVTGTATTPTKSYILLDQYYTEITHNSDEGKFARGRNRWSGSSVSIGNNTYNFKDTRINWYGGTAFADSANAGIYNRVIDDYQWEVMGTVLKNNEPFGNITFSSPPVNGTFGPYLIAALNNGENVLLDNLLLPVVTEIKNNEKIVIDKYNLSQNYPNPFNPTTVISYSISNRSIVTLKIYDTLGREITTLVNKEQNSGNYNVVWNAANYPSGIYFYNISAGNFSQTKKMILQK